MQAPLFLGAVLPAIGVACNGDKGPPSRPYWFQDGNATRERLQRVCTRAKAIVFFCGACILPGKRSARGNSVLWPVSRPSLARFSDAYPIVLWSGCHRSTALPPSLQPDGLPLLIIQPCQLISISFCALQTLCLPTCGRRLARFQCIPAV